MAAVVSSELKEQFMKDKWQYDSLSQAIKLAKNGGCSDKQIKPLVLEKQKYKTICTKNTEKMLRAMTLTSNIVHLNGAWYGVRYLDDKADARLKVDIMKKDDISMLERNARHESDLSRTEVDVLLPAMVDMEALELYKQSLLASASTLVMRYTGAIVDASDMQEPKAEEKVELVTTVSTHAGVRWVQRVIGVRGEAEAEEYRRLHVKEVNTEVLDAFSKAELVWEEQDSGITYYLDSYNVMYVQGNQGGNPNIITLYEEDFGFSKSINRTITLEQLTVLAEAKKELQLAEENVKGTNTQMEWEIQSITDKISILEAQIGVLIAEKANKSTMKDQASKGHRLAKDKYIAEFNKLFKKWDA